jgi:hypothetical protein
MSWERDEWRAALRADGTQPGDCYRHDMRPDGNGGGVCTGCGLTVPRGEM